MRHIRLQAIALSTAASLPLTALGHAGHDHGHWTSAAIHATFTLSMLALAAAGIVWVGARLRRQRVRLQVKNRREER